MNLRIDEHPVLGPAPDERLTIIVDGEEIEARVGDTVSGALWANGLRVLRSSRTGQPRGMYCGIGHCFECRAEIDSETNQRTCLRTVSPGMCVTTDAGSCESSTSLHEDTPLSEGDSRHSKHGA